jgi:hypothetical protein
MYLTHNYSSLQDALTSLRGKNTQPKTNTPTKSLRSPSLHLVFNNVQIIPKTVHSRSTRSSLPRLQNPLLQEIRNPQSLAIDVPLLAIYPLSSNTDFHTFYLPPLWHNQPNYHLQQQSSAILSSVHIHSYSLRYTPSQYRTYGTYFSSNRIQRS